MTDPRLQALVSAAGDDMIALIGAAGALDFPAFCDQFDVAAAKPGAHLPITTWLLAKLGAQYVQDRASREFLTLEEMLPVLRSYIEEWTQQL
ncbi:hypothetical protein [Modestobacter sp. NPDC049651]|uniref:hypothetical protein n=1 Tax=unclassified Modestobacter TaxID=2643866 RepID=UPI0033CAB0F6